MSDSRSGSGSAVILLIDDEKNVRCKLRDFLTEANYQVLVAEDGIKGLRLFEEENSELVLVDLHMPEMDGLKVLARIKEKSPEIPVLLMSGTGSVSEAVEALRLGAWDYLFKPFEELSVLRYSIEKALKQVRLIRENREFQEHLEELVEERTRELKKTTAELKKSEEKYRSIFENLQDVYYEATMDGTIIEISPSVASVSQYTREELLSSKLWKLYAVPEERELLLEEIIRTGKISNYEINLLDKDGTVIPCSITVQLYFDQNGLPLKLCGSLRNISRRKQAEKEKKVLEEQLHQSQKMEAIGSLTGGIAHDFNNLLTVINGHAEMALTELSKNQPLYNDINAIFQAGLRAANLTRQLLAFSRKQIIHPEVVDLSDVIMDLEKMLRRLIGENIILQMRFDEDVPRIKADIGQIEQILMNIVVNARDAVQHADEKKIIIETHRVDLDHSFIKKHPGCLEGLHTLLVIKDTGIGMKPETKAKIFEPFFTTKTSGTGLGMSTVYGIVKQNNGNIYVYSEPGQGTIFKIYWPATLEQKAASESKKIAPDIFFGKETILLVEDDQHVLDFASASLKKLGYDIYEARNGKSALELVKKRNFHPDLLFTDLVMPEMNGLELAEKLKEITPEIKILYSTGYNDNQLENKETMDDRIEFLYKPYSPYALAKKIREILDKK